MWELKSTDTGLLNDIKEYEGTKEAQIRLGYYKDGKYNVYLDTLNKKTIGFGHLVLEGEDFSTGLTDEEADALLAKDLESKVNDARKLYEQYKMTGGVEIQKVLTQMVFQMGYKGVSAFTGTLGAMAKGDYKAAANGMRNSLWYKQTTSRAEKLARIVESEG